MEERLERILEQRIRPAVYAASVPLDLTVWHVPGEPVPVADALAAEYRPFAVGDQWGAPLVEHVSACLANADLPVEEQRLERSVHARGWGLGTRVANDTFAVLRAGVDEPCGVAAVCGAGINCVGMLPDGRTARFLTIGTITPRRTAS